MKKNYLTNHPAQTKKIAETLAKNILKTKTKKTAQVLSLIGSLGGGKTTFLQGFAKGLGISQKILSPTFVILRKFKIPKSKFNILTEKGLKFKNFYHIDCYRIQKPGEILDLGFGEIISNSQNIVAIEWADRIQQILPKDTIVIKFNFLREKKRKIIISI